MNMDATYIVGVTPRMLVVFVTLAFAYALSVTAFLALQNRSPQSTFAWVLLFVVFPPGALLIYRMFGRGQYIFSRHLTLAKLLEKSTLADRAARVVAAQPGAIAGLADTQGELAHLAAMLWASGRSPLTMGNRLEILQNASEKYPRLLDDIRAASRSVHMVYYEWASDAFTDKVGEVLREKVRSGVEVRILYDPVGSYSMLNRQYVEGLRRDGVRMQPFSSLYQLHTLSYRSHRKLAIMDGRVGYSGGLNMTEKHLTGPKGFTGWRDTHTRITGEAVTILQSVFATMWTNAAGENLFDERYFPEVQAGEGGVPIQVVSAGPDSRWRPSVRPTWP
jgi:cardiolipin synthase A/B